VDATLSLKLGNRLPEIGPTLDRIEAFLTDNGAEAQVVFRFRLALDELLTNVVMHAHPQDEAHEIDVEMKIDSGEARCEMSDRGAAFDPFAAPAPDVEAELEDRPIGGLGIHLVREMVPVASYRREGDRNVVRLTSPLQLEA
jgi:anti-sigma regulatory factor (Ser/Thr protein kinase)